MDAIYLICAALFCVLNVLLTNTLETGHKKDNLSRK